MWCVCAQLYMDQSKKFLIILYVFGSKFYYSLCSCLVLTLFFIVWACFVLKNRCQNFSLLILATLASSKFWLLFLATRPVARPSSKFTQNGFATYSWLISRLASHETPRNSFLKGFLWEICFKPLPSSLKPLFQYFYIKTQLIWMVFHFINIFKVILNSFLWFWTLDYILESFCALGWDFHYRGWGDLIFVKFLYGIGFFWWFALDVGPL